jgi:hypothetical protein
MRGCASKSSSCECFVIVCELQGLNAADSVEGGSDQEIGMTALALSFSDTNQPLHCCILTLINCNSKAQGFAAQSMQSDQGSAADVLRSVGRPSSLGSLNINMYHVATWYHEHIPRYHQHVPRYYQHVRQCNSQFKTQADEDVLYSGLTCNLPCLCC